MKVEYVGGQAVIEGVMMKAKNTVVAVRRKDGKIVVKKLKSFNFGILRKIPFLRGFFVLLEALFVGIDALSYSAKVVEEEEIKTKDLVISILLAFLIGIFGFGVLPVYIAKLIKIPNESGWFAFIEGIIRGVMIILYIYFISFMKDIKRIFEYHGAEHKVVYTYENGEELTVENAKKYSTLHPRCGTSFLIITVFASIVIFSITDLLGYNSLIEKTITRIVLLPLVAGLAYEFQRFTAKILHTKIGKILAYPGLAIQKITTSEPDESQVEVALISLEYALKDDFDGEIVIS